MTSTKTLILLIPCLSDVMIFIVTELFKIDSGIIDELRIQTAVCKDTLSCKDTVRIAR